MEKSIPVGIWRKRETQKGCQRNEPCSSLAWSHSQRVQQLIESTQGSPRFDLRIASPNRLTPLQAAVGWTQLRRIAQEDKLRERVIRKQNCVAHYGDPEKGTYCQLKTARNREFTQGADQVHWDPNLVLANSR